MTCRGFFAYCRALLKYCDDVSNRLNVPRIKGINPAHSNSSNIEAWFSYVRGMKADSATSYAALVASKDMLKATQASLSLKNNKMYSSAELGDFEDGNTIGPRELVKYHSNRKERAEEMVVTREITYHEWITPAFSTDVDRCTLLSSLSEVECETLELLLKKELPNGYLAALLDEDMFRQRIRLAFDTPMESWFDRLINGTVEPDELEQFDKACQIMQDKIFELTVKTFENRKKKDDASYEYDLHQFHLSDDFADLCQALPCSLADNRAGCVMIFISLSRMQNEWMRDALEKSRKSRNPELFHNTSNTTMTACEENSEVNRFIGWAVFSTLEKFRADMPTNKKLRTVLCSMFLRGRDMNDEYISKYYDGHLTLLNLGGLTLINSRYFEWGKQAMHTIRSSFDENKINRDPQNAFDIGKRGVMEDERLKSQFISLCDLNSQSDATEVYDTILSKAIHARFAVVFRHWKEANVKKHGQVAFRTGLKARSKKAKAEASATAPKKNSTKKRKVTDDDYVKPSAADAAKSRKQRADKIAEKRRKKQKKC